MKPSFIYFILLFFLSNNLFSQTSILDNGEWFKIAVFESGVFKIDKNFFEKNNISIDNVDPKKIQVYGTGYNGVLPQLNSLSNKINPEEIQLKFYGNSDNFFDNDEFLYFYLQSSDKIHFDSISNRIKSEKNIYTDTAYYFININGDLSREINLESPTSKHMDQIINTLINSDQEKSPIIC